MRLAVLAFFIFLPLLCNAQVIEELKLDASFLKDQVGRSGDCYSIQFGDTNIWRAQGEVVLTIDSVKSLLSSVIAVHTKENCTSIERSMPLMLRINYSDGTLLNRPILPDGNSFHIGGNLDGLLYNAVRISLLDIVVIDIEGKEHAISPVRIRISR